MGTRVISDRTPARPPSQSTVATTAPAAIVGWVQASSNSDDEAEWDRAFASAEFMQLAAQARSRIAAGQTQPMRIEDL